ncbi:hypothetical protein C8R48DRAFT_733389 [Suillus tomentosus]|nr:hypothetical protein C8R48DRAFT_733389 [Suillus tomentosus]
MHPGGVFISFVSFICLFLLHSCYFLRGCCVVSTLLCCTSRVTLAGMYFLSAYCHIFFLLFCVLLTMLLSC